MIFIKKKGYMTKKITTKEFIEKARKIHGEKYDYSKVEYKKMHEKVCIICPEHGEFWQTPHHHLRGQECPKCGNIKISKKLKMTTEEFIEKARKVHGDKYDYSKVDYKNNNTKVCIIKHGYGEFWQTPSCHLNSKYDIFSNYRKLTKEEFIEKARKVHGDKYNYSKVEYVNSRTPVCIICPEHGEFWQTPSCHLSNSGCPKCAKKHRLSKEEFIEKARKVHGDKYDYSKTEYKRFHDRILITCPIHGDFMQVASYHLSGNGCPKCNESKLEKHIRQLLIENKIKFEKEKKFKWLKFENNLRIDFYLPDYNIGIECQGIQHFKPVDFCGKGKEWAQKQFAITQERDAIKMEQCEKNGIKLLYVTDSTDDKDILFGILNGQETM